MSAPTAISRFRILHKLGSGGMGDVYLAEDPTLDRTVALKVLPAEFAEDAVRLQRFAREAKAASAIKHANVAHIYEIGESDGVHYIVMEHVEGETLAAKLDGAPLPLDDILDIATQIADALDEAHRKGITHRDIKPGNVMLTDRGQVKVLDFGLARMAPDRDVVPDPDAPTEARTETGIILGTVQYMSPEQALARDVDGRSDIFSLGIVLYQLATGRLPFSGKVVTETLTQIISAEPPPISQFNHQVPGELERVIRKCLEKQREDRYQSAQQLADDLRTLKDRGDSAATGSQRRRLLRLAPIVFTMLAAVGGALWFAGENEPIQSLAVLPFENETTEPDSEYFSDGVTESVISNLSKLPDVKVISRNSAFHYKGQRIDARVVGRELDVEALVLGRVAQRGDDLAVSAELVRVRDNRQLWGARYQRTTADIFAIQEDLAQEISEALKVQLTTDEESRLTRQYTVSSEAYDAYLRGRYHWNRRTEESLRQAVEHFQDAIREDPSYALAYSALADTYSLFGWYYEPPTESYPKARAAAERALEIDNTLGEAHASRAYVKYFYEWDFAGAERGFLRAIELSPSYAAARQWYASNLAVRRRYDEAIQQVRVAIEVDPLSLVVNSDYGLWLVYSGQYEDGVEQLDKTLELQPDWAWAHVGLGHSYELQGLYAEAIPHYEKASELSGAPFGLGFLGHAYAKSGRLDDAHAILHRLEVLSRTQYLSPVETAYVHAGLGDLDATFEWLDKAHDERASALVWVFTFPISLDLAADPRFSDLKRRVGLEP